MEKETTCKGIMPKICLRGSDEPKTRVGRLTRYGVGYDWSNPDDIKIIKTEDAEGQHIDADDAIKANRLDIAEADRKARSKAFDEFFKALSECPLASEKLLFSMSAWKTWREETDKREEEQANG
jgi:hypothetical protein